MQSLFYVTPTMILCAGSLTVLMLGLWVNNNALLVGTSLASLVAAAGVYLSMIGIGAQDIFSGLLVHDNFGLFFSFFAILAVSIALILSSTSKEIMSDRRAEYYAILLALCSGLIFMSVANNFLMIYLALETVSILSYTLAGFKKERSTSVEASMKYVVYGALASALMVFGMSLIFGVTGQITLSGLREFFHTTAPGEIPNVLWAAVLLVFAGIGYKISAAPMHMWTPDVYQGAPTPATALFAVAPKAAGFALLLRFFITGFTLPLGDEVNVISHVAQSSQVGFHVFGPLPWTRFLVLSSIFTMFMGNLAAMGQVSVKRILAYSSIAHAGYMLMGATTQSADGVTAIMFYVVVYCFMNLGAFWITSLVEDALGGDELRNFRGLIYRKPLHAVCMAIFLFSLTGLPPFAGYIGKFYLFKAILAREMYGLAIIAAVNSVISLYYYAKILKAMCFEKPEVELAPGKSSFDLVVPSTFIVLLALPNLVLGIYWEPVMELAQKALQFWNPF